VASAVSWKKTLRSSKLSGVHCQKKPIMVWGTTGCGSGAPMLRTPQERSRVPTAPGARASRLPSISIQPE